MSSSQVNFRIPDDLRDRLKEAAEKNGRSLTAEIVQRLEQSFEPSARTPVEFRLDKAVEAFEELGRLIRERDRVVRKGKRGK